MTVNYLAAKLAAMEMDEQIEMRRQAGERFSLTEANDMKIKAAVDAALSDLLADSDTLIIRRDEGGAWPLWAVLAMRHGSEELDCLYEAASSQGVEPLDDYHEYQRQNEAPTVYSDSRPIQGVEP